MKIITLQGFCISVLFISNRDINLRARRLLLLAVVRPNLEYHSEVCEANKTKAAALESEGAKRRFGC